MWATVRLTHSFNALKTVGITNYKFVSYSEHAVSEGANSKAISYIQLECPNGNTIFGVGLDSNISLASIKGIICAINRAQKIKQNVIISYKKEGTS